MYGLLIGKKAVVTGAAQGIGKATALLYAQNGADVALCDLNLEKAKEAAAEIARETGRICAAYPMDVANEQSVSDALDAIEADFGRIDALCHSAGILLHAPLLDMSVSDWDKIFAVNTRGTFLVNRKAAAIMKKNGGGKLVNLSSCSGKKPTPEEGG